MQIHINKQTFTLLEMLIVLVVLGILASALIPRLVSTQARARDTKRKVDLRAIDNGLQTYRSYNSVYPIMSGIYAFYYSTTNTGFWIPEMVGLMDTMPKDPINVATTGWYRGPRYTGNYNYLYGGSAYPKNTTFGVNTYTLVTQLENPMDPDRCEAKLYQHYEAAWQFRCVGGSSWTPAIYEASIFKFGLSGTSY